MKLSARRLARMISGVLVVLLLTLPTTIGVPDAGFSQTVEQISQEDIPLLGRSLPCNEQGIVWNGLDNPVVAQAVQQAGSKVCDKLMLDAMLTVAQSPDLVSAEMNEYGQLTLQIIFPLIKTPIMIPVRNQDSNSTTFVDDAAASIQTFPDEWVPYMLDLNKGVPCSEGWSGVPNEALIVAPARTSAYVATCDNPAVEPTPLIDGAEGIRIGDAVTITPPRAIASVERIFLLQVTGTAATSSGVSTVYEAAFMNVAVVNNLATEALADVKREVERHGATLERTVFTVEVYLTETDLAADNPVIATARTFIPNVDDTKGVILPLVGLGESDLDLSPADEGCNYTVVDDAVYLTYANGCLAGSWAGVHDPGASAHDKRTRTVHESYYERNLGGDQWIVVGQIEDTHFINLPTLAGGYRAPSSANGTRITVPFQMLGAQALEVTTFWAITGDVVRRCDMQGSHCVAGGAKLGLTLVVHERRAGGSNGIAHASNSLLYADPMFFCAADTPANIPLYPRIQPFTGCFASFLNDEAYDNQVQSFNRLGLAQSTMIDVRDRGWLQVLGQVYSSVRGTSMTNMPSVNMHEMDFLGVRIRAVN